MRSLLLCIFVGFALLNTVQGNSAMREAQKRLTARVLQRQEDPICSPSPNSAYYLRQFGWSVTRSGGGSCFEKKGYFPSDFAHCNEVASEAVGGSAEDMCLKNCSDYSEGSSGHWRQVLEPLQTINFVKKIIAGYNEHHYVFYTNLKNLAKDKQKPASEQKFIHDIVYYRQVCVKISEPDEKMVNSLYPFTFIDTDGTHDYRLDHQVPDTGTSASYNSYWYGYRSGIGMCLGGGKETRFQFAYSATRFLLEDMIVRNSLGNPQASAQTLASQSYSAARASDILTSTKLIGSDCSETCAKLGSHPEKYNHQGKYYYTGRFRPMWTNGGEYIPASYLSYYRSKDNNEHSYFERECCCMLRKTKCPSGEVLMLAKTEKENNYCVSACPTDHFNKNGVCRSKAFEARETFYSEVSFNSMCNTFNGNDGYAYTTIDRLKIQGSSQTSNCAWVGGDLSPSTYNNGFGQNKWFYLQMYTTKNVATGSAYYFSPDYRKICCFQKRRTRCFPGFGISVYADGLHCYNSSHCNYHSNIDNTCRVCGTYEFTQSISVKVGEHCPPNSACPVDIHDTIDVCLPNSVQFCQHGYGYNPNFGGSCTPCQPYEHTEHKVSNGYFVPFKASACIADSHAVCPDGFYLDNGGPEKDSTCTCNAPGYQLGTLQKTGVDMSYRTEGRCNTTGDFYIPDGIDSTLQFFNQSTLDSCYATCQSQDSRFYANVVSAVWAAPISGKDEFHETDFFISGACQCTVSKAACSQWTESYDKPREFSVATPDANDSPDWANWDGMAWGWYVRSEATYENFVWDYSCDPCPAGQNSDEDLNNCIACPKGSSYNTQGEECMTWAVKQLGGTVVASALLENFQGKETLKNQIVAISGNTKAKQKSMIKLFADKMKNFSKVERAIVMPKEKIVLSTVFNTRIGSGTEVKLVVSGTKTKSENDANVCDEADFDVATDGLIFDISMTTVGDVGLLCRGNTPLVKMEFVEDGEEANRTYDTYKYKCYGSQTWDNWVNIQTTESEFSCNNKKYLVNSLGGVNCNYTSTLNEDGSEHAVDGSGQCDHVLESGEQCQPSCMAKYHLKSAATCGPDANGSIVFTPAVCAPDCNYNSTLNVDGSKHGMDGQSQCGPVMGTGEICRPTCMVDHYLKSPATCTAEANGANTFTPAVCAPACNYSSTLNVDGSQHAMDGSSVCGSLLGTGENCRPTCMVNYYLKSPATCTEEANGRIFTPAVCAPENSQLNCKDMKWMYFSGGGGTPCCEGMSNEVKCTGHLETSEMELVNSMVPIRQEDGSDCVDGMAVAKKDNKIICK